MKKLILIFFFILFSFPAYSATDFSLDANCQGFWNMDATSGNESDQCGSADLTEAGGTVLSDSSDFKTGTGSRGFTSGPEYFTHADGLATDINGANQSMSIGFWVKITGSSAEAFTTIISKTDTHPSVSDRQYNIDFNESQDKMCCSLRDTGDSSTASACGASTGYDSGGWIHFTCVYNDTDIRVYTNGLLDNRGTQNPTTYTGGIRDGGRGFFVGTALYNGPPVNEPSGRIDDLFIMDRALSAAEVLEIYQDGFEGNGVNTPEETILGSFQSAQADLNYFGGYVGIQTNGTLHSLTGNNSDRVTGQCVHDTDAFGSQDRQFYLMQPHYNKMYYHVIKGCGDHDGNGNNDYCCTYPSPRLDSDVVTNGTLFLDSDWSDFNSPTTNAQVSGTQLPWSTFNRHVVGDADEDGVSQSVLIRAARSGHNTLWDSNYKATGYLITYSGDVSIRISDGDGVDLIDQQITTAYDEWRDFETPEFTATHTGSTSGTLVLYCDGGPCSFQYDDIIVGEENYGLTYNEYSSLDQFNSGNEQYAILGGWEVEEFPDQSRFWIIDPLDNAFFLLTANNANNVDTNRGRVRDFEGDTWCDNVTAKWSVPSTCDKAIVHFLDDLKMEFKFNSLGSIITTAVLPPKIQPDFYTYLPVIQQTRVKLYAFSDIGYMDFSAASGRLNSMDDAWTDVFDADWEPKFDIANTGVGNSVYNPAGGWAFGGAGFAGTEYRRLSQAETGVQYDTNPYRNTGDTGGSAYVNPFYIGWDTDEEPRGSSTGWNNLAYMIFTSDPATSIVNGDGVNDTLIRFVNLLRVKYSDGGEDTFIANIGYDGSDEITSPDDWSTVTGTVAGKDASALTNLNTEWGTTYTTWTEVWYEDGDDDTVRYSNDANRGFEAALTAEEGDCAYSTTSLGNCIWTSTSDSTPIMRDLDLMHQNYSWEFHRHWHEDIFADGKPYEKLINFGMGMGGHPGWDMGLVASDGTKYLDIKYGSGTSTEDGGAYDDRQHDIGVQSHNDYNTSGIPQVNESTWNTNEWASDLGWSDLVVDAVYKWEDTTVAAYVGGDGSQADSWDCDTGVYATIVSGGYCSDSDSTKKLAKDTAIYWNCSDPTDVPGDCADTGTLFDMFAKENDQPEVHSNHTNKYIILADQDSIGNLTNNSLITSGTLMFTLTSEPVNRVDMVVSEGANFNTNADNWNALDNLFNWHLAVNEDDDATTQYMMIANNYATDRSIICYKTFASDQGFLGLPGSQSCSLDIEVGDTYHINFIFAVNEQPFINYYEPRTQFDKAMMYINIHKQLVGRRVVADDGTNYQLGFSPFSPIGDYGFASTGGSSTVVNDSGHEMRQFGWWSMNVNKYNGVEDTTDNGERANYGNFTGPVSDFFGGMYREVLPKTRVSGGVTLNGVSLR